MPAESTLSQAMRFFTSTRLIKIGVLAALFIWLFHGPLLRLIGVWYQIPDWSHGWLIPAFCVGILLYTYDNWKDIPLRPTYVGIAVIVLGLFLNILSTWWLRAITLQDYTAWLVAIGIILTLTGWRFVLKIWFPLIFFLFAIRLPGVYYHDLSSTLQRIAAMCSAGVLRLMGIYADLHHVVITVRQQSGQETSLLVAEACSGMRILMAFAALGSLMAYMVRRVWWHRLILVLAILPIAIISNVLRVTGMGVLHYFEKDDWAKGFAHWLEGMFMLPVAFVLFWLLHKLLSAIVIEEPPHEQATAQPAPASVKPARPPRQRLDLASLRQPHFLALTGVLLLAAASWQAVVLATESFFIKQPVPLKAALDRFPREIPFAGGLGNDRIPAGAKWITAHPAPPRSEKNQFNELIDTETEATLSAKHPFRLRGERGPGDEPDSNWLLLQPQYVQRLYRLLDAGGRDVPNRHAYFFMSYYTGMADAVPHIPDRCYLGGGWETIRVVDVDDLKVPGIDRAVPVRCMQFAKGMRMTIVVYFLNSNGKISNDHFNVRYHLNSPFGKFAYYSKIEINFPGAHDIDEAVNWTRDLLADFLPILDRDFLPDWEQYSKD